MGKKFLSILAVFAILLTACSSGGSSMSDSQIYDKLKEIDNWYVSDVWNDGLCDMGHYVAKGRSATGQDLDIEMTLKRYNEAMEKTEDYNTFVSGLDDEKYEDVKYAWDKLYNGVKASDEIIQANDLVAKSELDLETDKLSQYHDAFRDYIYDLKEE